MTRARELEDAVLSLLPGDDASFDALAREIEVRQRELNPVVAAFGAANRFLPVAAFREARVACFSPSEEEGAFLSSGTGSGIRARHPVASFVWYERVVRAGFDLAFGSKPCVIVGDLPGYAPDSSLVRMVSSLAARSGHPAGGVFTGDRRRLAAAIDAAERGGFRFILVGPAFGLVELALGDAPRLPPDAVVVETGGMKTRRREMTRENLHEALARGFRLDPGRIWSEFGMCELTSQAWSCGTRGYVAPPWMRWSVVEPGFPDRPLPDGEAGQLAVTDLANLHTAASLLTEDRAVGLGDRFEILGRLTGAELRGCNFLVGA